MSGLCEMGILRTLASVHIVEFLGSSGSQPIRFHSDHPFLCTVFILNINNSFVCMKFSNTYLGCCIFLHVACLFPKLEREKDNNNVKTPDVKVKKHAEVSIINPDLGVEKAKFVKGTAILKQSEIL